MTTKSIISSRVYATINLAALDENFRIMRSLTDPDMKYCAVIKTDGYGHGALPIARHLEKQAQNEWLWGFAVATVQEALALRRGGIDRPILILGYVFPQDYEALILHGIRPAVFTLEMAQALSDAAVACGRDLPIHLTLDTGMSRIGFPDTAQSADVISMIASLPRLRIEGLFSHFARADEEDKSIAMEALGRYLAFCDLLAARDVQIPIRHISNSAGILELAPAHLDMVRAGITIYGIYPSDEMQRDKDLRPLMELKSAIAYVKTVPAGTPVSYGGTYVTTRETEIATIPVGYGDGYPRSLSSKGCVLIHGKRCPILGRVCMDQFMVDVTGIHAAIGDEVTLMGKDGEEELTVDELGALSGRFPYEFVCDIAPRVPRVYRDEHGS